MQVRYAEKQIICFDILEDKQLTLAQRDKEYLLLSFRKCDSWYLEKLEKKNESWCRRKVLIKATRSVLGVRHFCLSFLTFTAVHWKENSSFNYVNESTEFKNIRAIKVLFWIIWSSQRAQQAKLKVNKYS